MSVQVYEQFNIAGRTAVVTGAAACYVGLWPGRWRQRGASSGARPYSCQGGPDGGADHQRGERLSVSQPMS